jgi:hypothetical protein
MAECIYTTGGTVQAQEGGLYLRRPADQQLLALCRQSRFAYVLTPRQLGKSSLMFRTAEELLAEGFRAVTVDLTQIGTHIDPETWYGDVLEVVAEQLELTSHARTWWQQEAQTGLTLRLTRFFEEVVLAEVSESIVIFVDEIDTTLSLEFTDDFFAAIRYFYVARAQNPALRRLSFVLIGVATPADLIRDPKRTPFNIGERVDLRDFTAAEAAPLAAGLPLPPDQAERALGWILGWTGGHPYLSQRLCSVLATDPPAQWSEAAVDQAVARTFCGERSEQDNNLQFVRDMLSKRAPQGYGAELLRTYRSIWQGKQPVADEEQNLVHAHLKLSGVVRRDGRQLLVRNRLYREVFNSKWIDNHNPEDIWKRYGPVLKQAAPFALSAVLLVMVMRLFIAMTTRQDGFAKLFFIIQKVERQRDQAVREAWRAEQEAWRAKQMLLSLGAPITPLLQNAEGETVVAYSPDGLQIARGGFDGKVWLSDGQSGAPLGRPLEGHQGWVLSLAFSPDGRQIASGGTDRTVRLWDAKTGAPVGPPLEGHDGWVLTLAFSPDGRQIASGGTDLTVRLWDAKTGEPMGYHPLEQRDWVRFVAFSPDGLQIISGSSGGKLRFWVAERGAPQARR